jgi:hypothetical protein
LNVCSARFLVHDVTPNAVQRYQPARLNEKAAPNSISDEGWMLLRLCGDQCA